MFQIAIIVFREILEIALVIGILAAATKNVKGRSKWLLGGLALGISGAIIVALFTDNISELFNGSGQELFNASVLLTCSFMIGYTVIWMNRYAKTISANLKELGKSISEGNHSLFSLLPVVAFSVLREGSEIALFSYGAIISGENISNLIIGAGIGFCTGIIVGFAIYYGLIKAFGKYFFIATSWMLIFLASGMVAQGLGFLSSGGFVPTLKYPLWDSSRFIMENSIIGKILGILIGYIARPSGMQVLGYCISLIILFIGLNYDKFFIKKAK